jgi:hypothetical protein
VSPRTSKEPGLGRSGSIARDGKAAREGGASGRSGPARKAKEAQKRKRQARRAGTRQPSMRVRFGRRSLISFGAGGVSIVVGYLTLASGSITLAPVLLVAGYCVFFPMGILMSERPAARRGGE